MENIQEDEIEIDLRELLFDLRDHILLILATGLLISCLVCAYTVFLVPPVYESTSSILVLTKETTLASLADLQMGSQLTNDYEVLITSRSVIETVIDSLGITDMSYEGLRGKISINNPSNTRILEITVEHSNPEMACAIVNKLTDIATAYIGDKMEGVPPKLIESGRIPVARSHSAVRKNALIGLLAGVFLCSGVIVLMSILDDTIKSEDDIERYIGIPTLASVPDRKDYIGTQKNTKKKKKPKKKKTGARTK